MSDEEAKQAADLTIREAAKLGVGFDVINDVSNFKFATIKGAEEIKRAQTFLGDHGVNRIISMNKNNVFRQTGQRVSNLEVDYRFDKMSLTDELVRKHNT
jgi:HrpA-like RNA helicase